MPNGRTGTSASGASGAPVAKGLHASRLVVGCVVLATLMGTFISSNPLTLFAGGATLAAIATMLWRPNDVPIFLLPIIFQWSEVAVKPILTVFYGVPIERVLNIGFTLQNGTEAAALFGFAGIACLTFGIYIGAGKPRAQAERALRAETQRWPGGLVLRLALGSIVLGRVAGAFAPLAGSAYQIVLAFAGLEYVGLFGFAYWCFINEAGYRYLIAIMGLEILFGFTGFFADFRLPIIVLAVAALAARPSFRFSSVVAMACLVLGIVVLATFWSEIKLDYRKFSTEGGGGQAVTGSMGGRLGYIYDAATNFSGAQFEDGFNKLLARHSYIDFLGATMNFVPSMVPHEDGRLVGAAIANMLMPRVLFPDKPPLANDTDITSEYTGIDFYSAADTSISIGYLGELYIDFGYAGALVAMTAIGACLGFGYRFLRGYERLPLLITYGACTLLSLSFMDFGTALIKAINGSVLAFAAALAIQRFIAPRVLAQFLPRYRKQQAPVKPMPRR
jgi:hypothetical protein